VLKGGGGGRKVLGPFHDGTDWEINYGMERGGGPSFVIGHWGGGKKETGGVYPLKGNRKGIGKGEFPWTGWGG